MSLGEKSNVFQWNNIDIVPVIPQRIVFAVEIRNMLCFGEYDHVGLCIPEYVQNRFLEGVGHIPNYLILGIDEIKRRQISFLPISLANPMVAAAHMAQKLEISLSFMDHGLQKRMSPNFLDDEIYAKKIGFRKYFQIIEENTRWPKESETDRARVDYILSQLIQADHTHRKTLFLIDFFTWHYLHPLLGKEKGNSKASALPKSIDIFKVSRRSIKNVSKEVPYVLSAFTHQFLHCPLDQKLEFDSLFYLNELIRESLSALEGQFTNQEMDAFYRYLDRYTRVNHRRTPDLNDLLIAAKQTLSEEATAFIHRLASKYLYSEPTKKYYLIDFSTKISYLTHPDKYSEKITAVNRQILRPLFKRLVDRAETDFTILKPSHKHIANMPLELLTDNLMRSISKKLEKPLKPLAPPTIIFDDHLDQDNPWHDFLENKVKGKYGVLFYANSYIQEFAYPGKGKCLFGGITIFKEKIKNLDYFNHPEAKGRLSEVLLYWSNFYHRDHILPYIADEPPSERFIHQIEKNGNYIFHLRPTQFPKSAIREFRKLYHLGNSRLNQLLDKI